MNFDEIKDMARNMAAADIFSIISDTEKSEKLLEEIRSSSDEHLDILSKHNGVPIEHYEIHRKMMRGEDNPYFSGVHEISGLLKTGDLILTGANNALINLQKRIYENVKSSHVAIIHAEYICVDAMPKPLGVTNRMVSEVLSGLSDNQWRVMRLRNLSDKNYKNLMKACAFYLMQPYLIWPSSKPLDNHSYCSELARKIYLHADIKKTGIPSNRILAPAHFDQLFDEKKLWEDVTEQVRPAVEFCRKYEALNKVTAKLFVDGLKLNRQRFKERKEQIERLKKMIRKKEISKIKGEDLIFEIESVNKKMHHQFWDFKAKK